MTVERIQTQDDHRTRLVASYGVQAYCCHPLTSHGSVIGTLSFGSKTRPCFSDEDVEVMHAVSQLVSLAMARLKMEHELRRADQRKDEFLATLAHELRNPPAPIRTGVALLKRAGLGGSQAPRIHDIMERQVDHIVRLVDDLLEVSRIRSGKIALKREPVDLAAIVRDAAQTSRELFDANVVDLTVTTPDAPLVVDADPVRMTQVVANLLNNAAKYTEVGGRASIEARREGDQAVLTVADTGVGIPGEMLPHVFDLFAQVDRTLGRAQGGLGIGLALVRNLVRMHGGEVEAHSAGPGKGSSFILRLPLTNKQRVCGADAGAPLAASSRASRILVVDDNRDAAESLAILLRAQGASVQVAFDGEAGVVAAETFEPEIVFLDLGMPGVDGYETARRLRSTAAAASATIVALTGWGGEMVQEDVRKAGFDLHMVKPASTHDIERAFVFRS